MSFDLMVFVPEAAPGKRGPFLDWYEQHTGLDEGQAFDSPAVLAPALREFFNELSTGFPPAPEDADEDVGTEYAFGPHLIYMSFLDWDKIDSAHAAVFDLAARHRLGFFDVSSDLAEVWLPDNKGGLRIAHSD